VASNPRQRAPAVRCSSPTSGRVSADGRTLADARRRCQTDRGRPLEVGWVSFTGAIDVLESTADVLRCTVENHRRDEPRADALSGRKIEKHPLSLCFRRAGELWRLE
jgi:hypothetical protein